MMPYMCYIASIPVGGGGGILMVPIDDNSFWRYNIAMRTSERIEAPNSNRPTTPDGRARSPYVQRSVATNGTIQREYVAENNYQIDRQFQKTEAFSGMRLRQSGPGCHGEHGPYIRPKERTPR